MYLKIHIATVHEKKKPFVCSMCPSKFADKGHLDKHIGNVHEKKKPFVCSICPSKFAEKGHLDKHIGAVHEKKKPYVSIQGWFQEGFDQEVQEPSPFDVKPKLEQIETSETGQVKIKTEPEESVGNDEIETLCYESIDIKDEFMWSMKDIVSDNVPPKNIEQEIVAVPEKKPIVKFTVETGENNPRKKPSFTKKTIQTHS